MDAATTEATAATPAAVKAEDSSAAAAASAPAASTSAAATATASAAAAADPNGTYFFCQESASASCSRGFSKLCDPTETPREETGGFGRAGGLLCSALLCSYFCKESANTFAKNLLGR